MIAEIFKQQRYEAGYRRGYEQGYEQGYKEGYALGLEEARREIREQGRREGVQAVQKAWEGWNGRRETAQANGQPFTEPPPTLDAIQNGHYS